jgi:hypothetical protein
MRKVILVLTLWAFAFVCASGQWVDEELANLRKFLDLPASTSIVLSTALLPDSAPMKVFIAAGNQRDYAVFIKNIDKWNAKEGIKFRAVEVVSDLTKADVILVRDEIIGRRPLSGSLPLYPIRSYSYIINRKPEGLEILWRRVVVDAYVDVSERGSSFSLLNEFFKRLKTIGDKGK